MCIYVCVYLYTVYVWCEADYYTYEPMLEYTHICACIHISIFLHVCIHVYYVCVGVCC